MATILVKKTFFDIEAGTQRWPGTVFECDAKRAAELEKALGEGIQVMKENGMPKKVKE